MFVCVCGYVVHVCIFAPAHTVCRNTVEDQKQVIARLQVLDGFGIRQSVCKYRVGGEGCGERGVNDSGEGGREQEKKTKRERVDEKRPVKLSHELRLFHDDGVDRSFHLCHCNACRRRFHVSQVSMLKSGTAHECVCQLLGRGRGFEEFITRMILNTDSAYILSSAYEKNIADLKAQLEMLRAQMAKSQSEIAKEEDAVRREGGRLLEESSLGRRQGKLGARGAR